MSGVELEQTVNVLSILSPSELKELDEMPKEAIVGVFLDDSGALEQFRPNPEFVEFLHHVVREAGPSDPHLVAAATAQGSGWVYMIDARTPDGPQGRVPPEDIIGAFEVESGKLRENGYQPNEDYRAFTAAGLVRLPQSLRAELIQALRERVRVRRQQVSQ